MKDINIHSIFKHLLKYYHNLNIINDFLIKTNKEIINYIQCFLISRTITFLVVNLTLPFSPINQSSSQPLKILDILSEKLLCELISPTTILISSVPKLHKSSFK